MVTVTCYSEIPYSEADNIEHDQAILASNTRALYVHAYSQFVKRIVGVPNTSVLVNNLGLTKNYQLVCALSGSDEVTELDAMWERSFAATQDLLSRLAHEAHLEYLAGETEDLEFDDNSNVL